jgi:hypothetical protein
MAEQITLEADGPHSPEYTRAVASSIAEAVRVLNYATLCRSGLEYPSDVSAVIGELAMAIGRLEQTFRQVSAWLGNEWEAGRVSEWSEGRHGGNAFAAVTEARQELDQAISAAQVLASHLNEAHQATSGLEAKTAV